VGTEKTSVPFISIWVVGIGSWGENLTVEFFESELLGLADEAEDHAPCDEVETGVETDWNSCQRCFLREIPAVMRRICDLQAPVAVMTVVIRGNVRPKIPAKVLLMHTAHAIPCSR
jgi:hypothetical protein